MADGARHPAFDGPFDVSTLEPDELFRLAVDAFRASGTLQACKVLPRNGVLAVCAGRVWWHAVVVIDTVAGHAAGTVVAVRGPCVARARLRTPCLPGFGDGHPGACPRPCCCCALTVAVPPCNTSVQHRALPVRRSTDAGPC